MLDKLTSERPVTHFHLSHDSLNLILAINNVDSMSAEKIFDLEQLRTLLDVIDAEGFSAAARRTDALQSTLSMKIKRLEAAVGQPLLIRLGRRVTPTAAGQHLADTARKILRLNDEAWGDLASTRLAGSVRVGVPDDYAASLSETIRTFRLSHPDVELDLSCAFSVDLLRNVQSGDLDVALVTRQPNVPGGESLKREQLVWVAAPGFELGPEDPLPLSVYPRDMCVFRNSMTEALTAADKPWKIVYTSMSLTGQTAMVGAGLAVTALPRNMIPSETQEVDPSKIPGLPRLPEIEIALHRRAGRPTEAAKVLGDMIRDRFPGAGQRA